MSRHIVLVHRAGHTGECWELLKPELQARGFTVHTPTLGGHRGNPRNPRATSMGTYVENIRSVVQEIGEPVVLLGHSTGGFVVSGVAEEEAARVRKLIYLCAFVPAKFGESSLMDVEPVTPTVQEAGKMDLDAGVVSFSAEGARAGFYNRCSPEVQDRAVSLLCPQPLHAMMGSITVSEGGLGAIQKVYIESTDDQSISLASQRKMQQYIPFDGAESIDSDHAPFFSMPEELAALINRVTT